MAKRKPRSPTVTHSEETIQATIQSAIPIGGVLWDYLTEIRLESNFGKDEFERGKFEGIREFAQTLQDKASYRGE